MAPLLGALILLFFTLLISRVEMMRFGGLITPFSVMAWPITAIVVLNNSLGIHFGFFAISSRMILITGLCFLFFIGGGGAGSLIIPAEQGRTSLFTFSESRKISLFLDRFRPIMLFLSILSLGIGVVQFSSVIRQIGWLKISSEDFQTAFGSGLPSHLMALARVPFVFFCLDLFITRNKKSLIFAALILLMVITKQVKYHIFILVLTSFFFTYLCGAFRLTLKRVLISGVVVYFLFNFTYVIGFSALGIDYAYSGKVQAFLLNHFFTYLFGEQVGFSEVLANPKYPLYSLTELVAIPLNILKAVQGDNQYIETILFDYLPISSRTQYAHVANTFGIFGTVYAFGGTMVTLMMSFTVGLISYIIRVYGYRDNAHFGWKFLYGFLLGVLALSFFGFYFNLVPVIEMFILAFGIPYLIYKLDNDRKLIIKGLEPTS